MSAPEVAADDKGLEERRIHYLNWATTVRSWLLPMDHKRVCIRYLCTITF